MSITPLRTLDHMTMAAARLARSSPHSWEEFLKALDAVSREQAAACVLSPPDKVFTVQGRAQQVAELYALFSNSVIEATRLEAKLKEKPHGR